MNILVVTAVEAERDAVLTAGCEADVIAAGVGPAEAAARTAAHLSRGAYDLVINAGVGGGFAPLAPGDIAVASSIVFADLGAQTGDGFAPVTELGFGVAAYDVQPALAVSLADRCGGHLGTVVTVSTVTGTAARASTLVRRFPDAVAEGMEGAGVAAAAAALGVPFAEVRAISNAVGPRDRAVWELPRALDALGPAITRAVLT